MASLNMSVDMLNLDITKEIIEVVKDVTEDERIDKKIREYYKNKIQEISSKYELKEG